MDESALPSVFECTANGFNASVLGVMAGVLGLDYENMTL